MSTEFNLAGMTFRKNVALLRPQGLLRLVADPMGTLTGEKHTDAQAVAVYYGSEHLGYVPAKIQKDGDKPLEWIHEQGIQAVTCEVKDYKYFSEEGEWNDEHRGKLMSVTVVCESKDKISRDYSEFTDERGYPVSITELLKFFPEDTENLIRWSLGNFKGEDPYSAYQAYMLQSSANGTAIHKRFEDTLKFKDTWEPAVEFIRQYTPKVLATEHKLYDKELHIAGTPDAEVEIGDKKIVLELKTGTLRRKHELQVSFAAHVLGYDEAWLMTSKTGNKQGFALRKIVKQKIEKNYAIVCALKKLHSML